MSADGVEDGAPSRREPKAFGKYRLIATLGHGGMADVFLAVAVGPAGFNKLQVIKRLRPSLAEEEDLKTMFLDEARLAARLNHRNVVQTNEVGVVDGQYFIMMEYLDGQPLSRIFRQNKGPLAIPLGLRVVLDMLSGLHYAHEIADYDGTPLGVVHRDVSPQNVFITYDGQVKIVDFGIAKAARRVVETRTGVIKGKVSYMAPEQAFTSSAEIDRRADVFSVGVILWEMIAGRRLWAGQGDPEIIASLLQDVPSITTTVPDVSPELARICDKALARRREDRYASASAMRADLERLGIAASPEDLGSIVEKLFHEARSDIKATIERQLSAIQSDATLDLLNLETIPSTGSPVSTARSRSGLTPPGGRQSRPDVVTTSETPAPSTLTARRLSEPAPRQSQLFAEPESKSRAPLFLGAILVLAAGGAGYLLLPDRDMGARAGAASAASASATATADATVATAKAPAAAPSGALVHVRIKVNPLDARIKVDGVDATVNPFEGDFPKDGAMHKLQIEANGFFPQSRFIPFNADVSLDLTLLARPKAASDPVVPSAKPDPYDDKKR